MKTVSFDGFQVGRGKQVLLDLDSSRDGLEIGPGLTLLSAPNGMGKTTLLQSMAGLLRPLRGDLLLGGRVWRPQEDILLVPEYLAFPRYLYPREWIELIGGAYLTEKHGPWVEEFRLERQMRQFVGRLSQGERRKITWLAALHSSQPVLLLDEPFDGLDFLAVRTARKILEMWKKEGRIVCVVSHQASVVVSSFERVLGIRNRTLAPILPKPNSAEELETRVLEFYG